MTLRAPLVQVGGYPQQVQSGDYLLPSAMQMPGIVANGKTVFSVGSNIVTVNVSPLDNATFSAANPGAVVFRDKTATTTGYTQRTLTTNTHDSSVPNGGTMGTSNSTPFRLWAVLFDDDGTLRTGLVNCWNNGIYPLRDDVLASSVPVSTGSDSAHVIYSQDSKTQTGATVTIASPAVVSWTAHGLVAGQAVVFTTTGALPTGLTAGTTYYVISAGLATDTFRVSATLGGSAVNTSGSQSGTHTAHAGIYQKPMRVLGYADWDAGQATAGTWATSPTKVQDFMPGVPLPGMLVQEVPRHTRADYVGTTTTVPNDDTIMQVSEGAEFFTLTITPTAKTNVLEMDVEAFYGSTSAGHLYVGFFQDGASNAIQMGWTAANAFHSSVISHQMLAATVAATTMSFRMGPNSTQGGTGSINGYSGARYGGGAVKSRMRLLERQG